MWHFFKSGFFNYVIDDPKQPDLLTIKARVKSDLEKLKREYLPTMGDIVQDSERDYPFMAVVKREDLAKAAYDSVMDIDYTKTKPVFERELGRHHASTALNIWNNVLEGLAPLSVSSKYDRSYAKSSNRRK